MSDADKNSLIKKAVEARRNAYAPYSNFKVGAALLTSGGKVYAGCNFENAAFGAGVCAERVALGSALASGEREFRAIAVSGGETPATPCGICRQALSEFGDMSVICSDSEGGNVIEFTLGELLPHGFCLNKC